MQIPNSRCLPSNFWQLQQQAWYVIYGLMLWLLNQDGELQASAQTGIIAELACAPVSMNQGKQILEHRGWILEAAEVPKTTRVRQCDACRVLPNWVCQHWIRSHCNWCIVKCLSVGELHCAMQLSYARWTPPYGCIISCCKSSLNLDLHCWQDR